MLHNSFHHLLWCFHWVLGSNPQFFLFFSLGLLMTSKIVWGQRWAPWVCWHSCVSLDCELPSPRQSCWAGSTVRAQLGQQRHVNLEAAFSPLLCQLPALPLKQVVYFQSASSHVYAKDKENAVLTSAKIFMYACGQNKAGRCFPLAELHLGKQAVRKHGDDYGPNNFELFIIVKAYQSQHV